MACRHQIGFSGVHRVDSFSVTIQLQPSSGDDWWLTCVYGPQGNEDKLLFLQELRDIRRDCPGPWIIMGDFNLIYKDEDKNNSIVNRAMMGRFRRLINDLGLKDIPLLGRKYTWSNGQDSPTLVRLDRMLCSLDWETLFPDCLLQSASTDGSDHCPLLLGLQDNKPGKRRFHFETFWTKLDGFMDTVAVAWSSVQTDNCPFNTLAKKFNATSRALQSWSQKRVGHVESQLGLTKEVLHQLEIAQDLRSLSTSEIWLRNNLKKHFLALSSLRRTIARSRSRIAWLADGDANTAMFHAHARYRKQKNFIGSLLDGDQLLSSHEDKERAVHQFYFDLIGTSFAREHTVNLDELNFTSFDLSGLENPFSEEEVWRTISHLPSDKAPGPDGFTGRFYKSCWSIIKEDVMRAVSAVWSRKMDNLGVVNSAYITLIPKKEDAAQVKDFRPISLVHSFGKLITKILANRLASRLNDMVSPNQSAFIKGRSIQDNFMLVQQTARFLHQQKQARLLLKLDISKAFDSVSWPFLLEVLQKLGFGQIWCDILSGLLASSSTQILLNGTPGVSFLHKRGLRQGDPLSPMLFILVMDVLSLMISKASVDGLLLPLSRRSLQHRVSIYADDVVLFLQPTEMDMNITSDILGLFGEASGLKTNFQKSNIYPIHCADSDLSAVHDSLGCDLLEFPCKYLGLPLSLHKLTRTQIQPLIDKIADRLPGWKADLLTREGRRILVQSVLTSMVVYLSMAAELPPWAIKEIDKIRRRFLWRGRKDINGGHCLVAWPKVCRPLELGGLGIADLQKMGWALRMRWLWLQKTEPNKPWSGLQFPVHKVVRSFFSAAMCSEVGNGNHTLFWTDKWLHGQCISELAPRLFLLVSKRNASKRLVSEALPNHAWIVDLQGALGVTALTEYLKLWDILSTFVLQPDIEDRHIWRLSTSGQYSAKSAYWGFFQGSVHFESWEHIWKSWAPGNCSFFLWLVAHDKCWTADRLARRGLQHHPRCLLCDQEPESINHLLAACVFSRQFWFQLLQKVGLQRCCPHPGEASFMDWWRRSSDSVSGLVRHGLNSIIILGAWFLWRHRNRCVFDGAAPDLLGLQVLAEDELKLWALAGAKGISHVTAGAERENPG